MAASLDDLVPDFRPAAEELLARLRSRGIEMRPNETLRDPFKQARFWRQSRSIETIRERARELRSAGAGFLAFCLESVGPQHGRHVTNALPGLSWHQWGEALDCFWVVDGRAEWSEDRFVDGVNGFREYASAARAMGLTAGGFFTSLKDFPHVQLRPAANPRSMFSLREISNEMERRFG
ncbi:MAG TPA: M15 family metallopeptidase [Longimicrobium sp.]|jgi:hypothetical protein